MRHPVILTALLLSLGGPHFARAGTTGAENRDYAVKTLDRIARPVIESLAAGELKKRLPLGPGEETRREFT